MENEKTGTEVSLASKSKLALGGTILVIGFLTPLLIPFVRSSDLSLAWKNSLSGFLALGIPEIFMLIAIAVMGKPGYELLKKFFFQFLRRNAPPRTVSKSRYRLGLVLFSIVLIFGFALPYIISYSDLLAEPLLYITLGSDAILIISLLILGGDFWDKLRSLFIYNSRAILLKQPDKKEKK